MKIPPTRIKLRELSAYRGEYMSGGTRLRLGSALPKVGPRLRRRDATLAAPHDQAFAVLMLSNLVTTFAQS